jgi:hypothetical protein
MREAQFSLSMIVTDVYLEGSFGDNQRTERSIAHECPVPVSGWTFLQKLNSQ